MKKHLSLLALLLTVCSFIIIPLVHAHGQAPEMPEIEIFAVQDDELVSLYLKGKMYKKKILINDGVIKILTNGPKYQGCFNDFCFDIKIEEIKKDEQVDQVMFKL